MRLYIVRHGETVQNKNNIIQGQQEGNLSPLGLEQRIRLKERLLEHSFDVIYSSDLKRTRDTLAPYIEATGASAEYTPSIRERAFGTLEGQPGEKYVELLRTTGLSRIDYRPPNGENFHDLKARTDLFLKDIFEKHAGQSVLLMTHGGTIRTLLATLLQMRIDELLKLNIHNTSVSSVTLSKDFSALEYEINNFSHLDGLPNGGESSFGVDKVKS